MDAFGNKPTIQLLLNSRAGTSTGGTGLIHVQRPQPIALSIRPQQKTDLVNTPKLSTGSTTVQAGFIVRQILSSGTIQTISGSALSECISVDTSIIKVSSDCSRAFLSGTETQGGDHTTAKIQIKLGALVATHNFRVWFPKLPVTLRTRSSTLSTHNAYS